jgi:hypothetical protein
VQLRRRRQIRNDLLTVWLRRPVRVTVAVTAGVAVRAVRDADQRAALLAAARLLPAVLRRRRRLPGTVEHALSVVEADGAAAAASGA